MEQKTLYLHSRGQPVRALQLLLKKYEPGLAVDGLFGPRTERAVRAAQRKLEVVPADGIAGPYTLAALTKAAKGSQSANPLPRPKPPDHPSSGSQLSAAVHKAGAAVGSAAHSAEHAVVNTVEQAIAAIEKFIAGLHAKPPQVPANIHPVVQPSKAKAKNEPQPPGEVRDPKTMTMSDKGIKFVFGHEAGAGMAALHLPSSGSGVTVGPGYDMGERTPKQIVHDLTSIGVPQETAQVMSGASKLTGTAARAFIDAHPGILSLSIPQQRLLELNYQAPLVQEIRDRVHVPLHQYEFDALVSFAGNAGKDKTGINTATRLMNEHKPAEAAAEIMKYVYSGHERMNGLINRRSAEVAVLLYGNYDWVSSVRQPHHNP